MLVVAIAGGGGGGASAVAARPAAPPLTVPAPTPAVVASLARDTATLLQTCDCAPFSRTAIFKSLDGTVSVEALNCMTGSAPRFVQRPCSTQNDEIGSLPECAGRTKSVV